MRHILIDRARRKQSKRYGGDYERVDLDGFELAADVLIAQNPTKSLADDVAVTKSAIDCLDSEVMLVGHAARTLSAVR